MVFARDLGWHGLDAYVKMFKNLANQKNMITINYPEEKHEYSPRFKGNHVLTVKERWIDSLHGLHAVRDELPS